MIKQPKSSPSEEKETVKIPFLPEDLDEPQEIKAKIQEELDEFQTTFLEELSQRITASFGLLAALAWRGVIQELVNTYIKKFLGDDSGILSETIFARIITVLAVVVTWRLAKLKDKILDRKAQKKQ
jgi:hypothetical protein